MVISLQHGLLRNPFSYQQGDCVTDIQYINHYRAAVFSYQQGGYVTLTRIAHASLTADT